MRCLAVMPVILFHLGVHKFSGGYVGVDIFFVISGYLITGIVARDISDRRFSFAKFYERRVRRIAPALLSVLVLCTVGAYLILLPGDLRHYGHSLAATLFSYANVYFWTQAGYFKPTYVKLLLHTWSLSVEEQYYVVLPLTIYFLRHRWNTMRLVLLLACLGSLGVSSWLAFHHPEAAFYMPYSRAWELLIGSLLAIHRLPHSRIRVVNESLAFIGLGLIGGAILLFKSTTPFPGFAALVPCIGTALLLYTGESGTVVGSLLALRPFAFIGLISYSVYLIHWPLILFSRMGLIPGHLNHDFKGKVTLVALSILLGAISWKFIESPFRISRSTRWNTRRIWAGFCCANAVLLVIAAMYVAKDGFPSRFPAEAIRLGQFLDQPEPNRAGTCFITNADQFEKSYDPKSCTARVPGRSNYAVVGDSHAAALWYGLTQVMKDVHFAQVTSSGCFASRGGYDESNCGRMRRFLYEEYLPNNKPDLVLFVARWISPQQLRDLAPTVRWYQQQHIPLLIVGPVQEYDVPLPMLLAIASKQRDSSLPLRYEVLESANLDSELQQIARNLDVPYLSSRQPFCEGMRCEQFADSGERIPVLIDDNHLTYQAAEALVRSWVNSGKLSEVSPLKSGA